MNEYLSSGPAADTPDVARGGLIDLGVIWERIWAGYILILVSLGLAVMLALVYLHLATYRFTADVVVVPTDQQSSARSGLSSLASLAGVNVSQNGGSSPFLLYTISITSRPVAEMLSRDQWIMQTLFRDQWDADRKKWKAPGFSLSKTVKEFLGIPVEPWHPPGAAEVQQFVLDHVSVNQDPQNSTADLAFSYPDRAFADYFVDRLNRAADEYVRERALSRASKYVEYLNAKLQKTSIAEYRESLMESLSEQEKELMMASSNISFAAEPIGVATVSDQPTSPKPFPVAVLSIFIGFVIGILLAVLAPVLPFLEWFCERRPGYRRRESRSSNTK